jgi:hypothetical protein
MRVLFYIFSPEVQRREKPRLAEGFRGSEKFAFLNKEALSNLLDGAGLLGKN